MEVAFILDKESGFKIAILFFILSIGSLTLIYFNSDILIPPGYDLAIDGYVVSKTMILIFIFYLLSKFGVFIYNHTKQD